MFDITFAYELVNSSEKFPVDFNDLWQWCGYASKNEAKRMLTKNFERNFDFSANLLKTPSGGRPSEAIMLTVDSAKEFAMLAQTTQGKEVRKYFIQAEKISL